MGAAVPVVGSVRVSDGSGVGGLYNFLPGELFLGWSLRGSNPRCRARIYYGGYPVYTYIKGPYTKTIIYL